MLNNLLGIWDAVFSIGTCFSLFLRERIKIGKNTPFTSLNSKLYNVTTYKLNFGYFKFSTNFRTVDNISVVFMVGV